MKYLWIDTESTGLPAYGLEADASSQPRVCSIGFVFIDDDLNVEHEQEFLIKPHGWFLDPGSEAAKINKLTQEQLEAHGVPIAGPTQIYATAIAERRIIGGHNISHDCKMMRGELRRQKFDDMYMRTKTICTMRETRKLVGALDKRGAVKAPRLEESCAYFGIQLIPHLSALADAKASFQLRLKLRDLGIEPKINDPYEKGKKHAHRKTAKASLPERRDQDDHGSGEDHPTSGDDDSGGNGPRFL